ncbi:hypothetical protein [Streptomyces sp. CA-106131]|uniref:hypothetical protein n=1 Tax=Streptomyces sp. CA-106131 TaxID=3240045 RepID=UPI003D904628
MIEFRTVIIRFLVQDGDHDGHVDVHSSADAQRILCNRKVIGNSLVRPCVAQITV